MFQIVFFSLHNQRKFRIVTVTMACHRVEVTPTAKAAMGQGIMQKLLLEVKVSVKNYMVILWSIIENHQPVLIQWCGQKMAPI